jgi:TPR repeat protein
MRLAECFEKGDGIEADSEAADYYCSFAAEQGNAEAECGWALRLLRTDFEGKFATALHYLRSSAAKGNGQAQLTLAHHLMDGIGCAADHIEAAKYLKLSAESSAIACAWYGRCLRHGCGVGVNLSESVEYFQRAADCGNADGANCLGVSLECGESIDRDINRALVFYRKAALQKHAAGMNNFGRCLEKGLGIECNLVRAAKYFRLAGEFGYGSRSGENNFGVCLERGMGVRANQELAAEYYKRASNHGDADGANNFGFCLEHGRGVPQNIAEAAEYYKLAADRGHPEAAQNHRRCLRLLGRWVISDCWGSAVEQTPSFTEPETEVGVGFEGSLSVFAATKDCGVSIESLVRGVSLGEGEFSSVALGHDSGEG